jgi:hypothetical protein
VPGHWERAQRGRRWTAGRWQREPSGPSYVWVEGSWGEIPAHPSAPPPAPRVERVSARKGYLWIDGRYQWRDGDYMWIPGHWERARAAMRWYPGHWDLSGAVYVYTEGEWRAD